MANRTVKDAQCIRGTNPQYLVEKIIRSRIYDSRYWKEECFALSAELLVDKAMELKSIGGVFGGNVKPTNFICLILKMLQIQPEKDIIVEFIRQEDFKYVRALGAFYMRLVGTSLDCYKYLEPLYNDYRKVRRQTNNGNFDIVHMDEFIDNLLHDERTCDVILPRIQKRQILEETNQLELRVSALEEDLEEMEESEDEEEGKRSPSQKGEKEEDKSKHSSSHRGRSRSPHKRGHSPRRRSRSRERHRRSRSRDRDRDKHERTRDRDRDRDRERDRNRGDRRHHSPSERERKSRPKHHKDKDRDHERSHKSKGKTDDDEIAEANALRAKLGLAPLRT